MTIQMKRRCREIEATLSDRVATRKIFDGQGHVHALISALPLILAMKLRGISESFSRWLGTHEAHRPPASSSRELCTLERSLRSSISIPKFTIGIKPPSFSKLLELIAIISHQDQLRPVRVLVHHHGREEESHWTGPLGLNVLLCIHGSADGTFYFCSFARSAAGWYVPADQSVVPSITYSGLTNRFADDFSAKNPGDSDASGLLTVVAATAPASVPTAATEIIANATAISNGTAKASSISSADAVATTASSPLNSTNDPNMCHRTYTTDPQGATYIANPFCKPFDGQEVYPNIRYQGKCQAECPC